MAYRCFGDPDMHENLLVIVKGCRKLKEVSGIYTNKKWEMEAGL